jgi:hypothetical protein
MGRIYQASVRQMTNPSLVNVRYLSEICGRRRTPVAPSTPVAIKPVYTVGHINTRLHDCGASKQVFGFEIDNGVHSMLRAKVDGRVKHLCNPFA